MFRTQLPLRSEPFVAYVRTREGDGPDMQFLICRLHTPHGFTPITPGLEFGSYLGEIGRLVSLKPGRTHAFESPEPHAYDLLSKAEFRPRKADGIWDAVECRIAWIDGQTFASSLREFLAGTTELEKPRRAELIVQLPARAILDAIQDDIFRLPFYQRVRISGAPGTGKTTVLLKRLSQKTKLEFLSEAERARIRKDEWQEGRSWMLFTPSDLLKAYLKEALNKELLPADDGHVKVYSVLRGEVLRELRHIRVGNDGVFRVAGPEETLLKREKGLEHVQLTQRFGIHLAEKFSAMYRDALQKFNNETRGSLAKLADANQRVLLTALDVVTQATDEERGNAQQRAAAYRKLNADINSLVARIRHVNALFDRLSDTASLRDIYQESRRLSEGIPNISSEDIEAALFPEIPELISGLRREVRDLIESLALRRLFEAIPRTYQDYRQSPEVQERFFDPKSDEQIRERKISGPEQDLLLYHSLEFVRSLEDILPGGLEGVPQSIRSLMGRMCSIVAIDETTDFSPLEVACMERFAFPNRGGVTLSGDLMQRVTRQGLKAWDELDELSTGFVSRELAVSYRQTARLFAVAKDLYQHVTGLEATFQSAFSLRPEDPAPLAVKVGKDLTVDAWLSERIEEIFNLCGRLPTIAILVPSGDDVDVLRQKLQTRLQPMDFQVDGSRDGNNLGDAARVRISPVEFIKGLEFEAVFYVGIDRMSEIHKELIEKYLYVGLSRARSFLGVAYERQFPQRLQCVESHFVQRQTFAEPIG